MSDVTLVDAAGTQHMPCRGEARIVSLVPSLTELLCDLGLREQMVGRTRYCIHPQSSVKSIVSVGGTKDVALDKVRALDPTHVVVNIDENLRETAQALREFVPNVVVTHPCCPDDNLEIYSLFGAIFDCRDAAGLLSSRYREKLAGIRAARDSRVPQRVLYLIWREPWMTVCRDTYISRTLAEFGLSTEPVSAMSRYPEIQLNEFAGKVAWVLLSSEPYPFRDKHIAEIEAALPNTKVRLIDGEMASWYGSRALQALDYLDHFSRQLAA